MEFCFTASFRARVRVFLQRKQQNPGKFLIRKSEIFRDFETVNYRPFKPRPEGRGN